MIFISRFKNYKLGLRATNKQVVNNQSGSEEVIMHKGVTVAFSSGIFDTKRWQEYSRPESPDKINTIRSEDDLIRLMKSNPYFNIDFSELLTESNEQKRARLLHELSKLDAEDGVVASDSDVSHETPISARPAPEPKVGKKVKGKKGTKNKNSVVDL